MKTPTHNAATGKFGKRAGNPPADEAAHIITCPVCGQAFDCRDLGQVLHHATRLHQPLPRYDL
ncbi:hypothetical protein [Mesorhizobium sp.]|uniref:hypothetical protein n=1 Tax=Mesorhizobium sp. TaxID=1871066 RepID=UPI000FE4EF47|nr:hypothetical protein [Mesorhizobium sp.]RWI96067.1 MAG: hypothetical protein EOR21_08540 [Mesorhizobium sp.]